MEGLRTSVVAGVERLRREVNATPRRRRGFRVLVLLFGLWLLFCLLAWLAGPTLVRHAATGFVEEEFGHRLVIADLGINPLKLALTIEGLSLADAQQRQILGFRRMVVDVDVTSVFRAMAILDEFRLDGLTVNVERLDADRFNFSDLADRLAARFAAQAPAGNAVPAEESAPVDFLVRHLDISEAALRFADHTRKPVYESWMRPLNLRMDDLTSRPDSEAPYNIAATLGTGGVVSWEGDLTLEPLRSKGAISLKGFGLSAAYDYVKDDYRFALPDGTLDARFDYFADFSGTQSVLRVDDGRVEVKGLAITDEAGAALFAFERTLLAGLKADVMKSTASVGLLETRGGRVNVVLAADGRSNLEAALVPRTPPSPAKPPVEAVPDAVPDAAKAGEAAPAQQGWQVELKAFAIRDYVLDLVDNSTRPAVQLRLADVDFETSAIRLPELPAIPFVLTAALEGGGAFGAKGEYTLDGGLIDTEVSAEALPLAPFSPYLASVGRVTLLDGLAYWQGRVRGESNLATQMQVSGGGALRRLVVRDDVLQQRLAGFRELAIEGLDYDDHRQKLALKKVTLTGLDVDVSIDAKGVSNLQKVTAVSTPAAPAPAAPATTPAETGAVPGKAPGANKLATPAQPALALRLDSFQLREGRLRLRDNSPDLAFVAEVSALNGRVDGLSSDPAQRARVQLDGMINRYAPLSVSGSINPLAADTYADVQVRLASLDLGALTPYTVTYVSYPLARGSFGAELDWKVADRRFEAKNRVLIKGLALGEKQPAPRALKLPVRLGVALLTNRDGDADLQVPAYGDLDDPQFRYGRVVLKALGNLITRAATAPFAALGNFGGDKPDLVIFRPGEQLLTPAEGDKLARIAASLAEKPALVLAITGVAAADSDRAALREQELSLRLRRAWLESEGKRGMTVDQVVLDGEARSRMLARLYRQATGQGVDALRDEGGAPLPALLREQRAAETLLNGIAIDEGVLRQLARERSQRVKDAFLAAGLAENRLVIVDGKVALSASEGGGVPTQLALEAP